MQSEFLKDFRDVAGDHTRGCIVLERPDVLKALVDKHSAKDSTVRKTAMAELEAMQIRTSQFNPAEKIPEKSWAYRFAKRHWFSDFGVYDGKDHANKAAPDLVQLDTGTTTQAEVAKREETMSV